MRRSYLAWLLLVAGLASAAFVLLLEQVEDPLPTRTRPTSTAVLEATASHPAAEVSAPLARILFAFDRAQLEAAEAAKLAQLVAQSRSIALERIDAVGHADRIGAAAYNVALSRRRAEQVKAYLVSQGVDARLVRIEAVGESDPLTGDTCRGRGPENARNWTLIACLQPDRRVAVTVVPRAR